MAAMTAFRQSRRWLTEFSSLASAKNLGGGFQEPSAKPASAIDSRVHIRQSEEAV